MNDFNVNIRSSLSPTFGNDPDGYEPEPQLNGEEILAAVTDFVFDRTHSHSLTGTSISGSYRSLTRRQRYAAGRLV